MPKSYSINSFGDKVNYYSKEELKDLYMQEGLTEEEAIEKAEELHKELYVLNYQTKNIWKRSKNR